MGDNGHLQAWLLCGTQDQWRRWEDEIVIRVDSTGDTHHLAPLAGAIFEILRNEPAGLAQAEIVDRLAADADDDPVALHPAVGGALEELQRIALVCCRPPRP